MCLTDLEKIGKLETMVFIGNGKVCESCVIKRLFVSISAMSGNISTIIYSVNNFLHQIKNQANQPDK